MADSTMHIASTDCVAMVQEIGARLRNVVPRYLHRVKGDLKQTNIEQAILTLPQGKFASRWVRTFLEINARFNGRKFGESLKKKPGKPDYRINEGEIVEIASLAQWLVNLHSEAEARMSGQPCTPKQLTVRIEDMIERPKIIG